MLYKALQSLVVAAYLLSFLRSSEGLQSPFDAAHNPSHDLETSAETISAALAEASQDPAAALLSLRPDLKTFVDEPRLLLINVEGIPQQRWMTEGDKFRLKRRGETFIDITEHGDWSMQSMRKQKARTPQLSHRPWICPLFQEVSVLRMTRLMEKGTSFFSRCYLSQHGVKSCRWLHDVISDVIVSSPLRTYISLEYHTHRFPQPSIIARFEPLTRNASSPITIIGAHQDSLNYVFPLLPAPGADDDLSGSISTLEAFTVLAGRGYIPREGPVEFHWYAAEEGGLLGSQDVVAYHREQCGIVGAMIEFDMTGWTYKGPNATNVVMIDETDADPDLTAWLADLVTEYIDIPPHVRQVPPGSTSDYSAWTLGGYPSSMAHEGVIWSPPLNRSEPGNDRNDWMHNERDRMDVDVPLAFFSVPAMARFSRLAIAFAIEQAGWASYNDNRGKW